VGGEDPAWDTTIENACSGTQPVPLVTFIMMFASVPTSAALGVPFRSPVAALKLAQPGLFWIQKFSGLPAAPATVGEKLHT
jgi:hypothetical protein